MGIPSKAISHYPPPPTAADFRFTTNHGNLYATGLVPPENNNASFEIKLATFRKGHANIQRVTLVDGAKPVPFKQSEEGLICTVPALETAVAHLPYTLKLEGSMSSFDI